MGRSSLEARVDASTPAVVLRSGRAAFPQHGALGIVRSLGRLGVHVTMASPTGGGIAASSRYLREGLPWSPRAADDPEALSVLHALSDRRPGALLVPTDDLSAVFVDANAEALRDRFLVPKLPVGVVPGLVDKLALAEACARAGVPAPVTAAVHDVPEAEAFLAGVPLPIVVKADLASVVAGTSPSVTIAVTSDDVRRAVARGRGMRVLLQEHIPGASADANWIFNGYLDGSTCRFAATGRKTGQYPIDAGMATAAVTERNDEVTDVTLALLESVGYVGPVDVDLRFDARDARYKVTDVNPRIGGSFRAFVSPDGLDTIRATYLEMTGQDVPPSVVPDGRTWIVETHVLASAVAYRREGWPSTRRWLRSLAGVDEGALFGSDDLRPMLGAAGHAVARIGGRLSAGRSKDRSKDRSRG